ncbi:MAG: hypothetical protein JRC77_02165, partial [Deltaproteobacteria bacterium]|nr:hypothetical protein [Deltaproteobacteria bacterium]
MALNRRCAAFAVMLFASSIFWNPALAEAVVRPSNGESSVDYSALTPRDEETREELEEAVAESADASASVEASQPAAAPAKPESKAPGYSWQAGKERWMAK